MNDESNSSKSSDPAASRAAALGRARAAALAELRRQPRAVPWRREALNALLLVLASTAAVMLVGSWFSIVEVDRLRSRFFPLLLLLAVQTLGVFAAIAPGNLMARRGAAVLAALAALAIMAGRGAGEASANPEFACSASHLAVDLIPLGLLLYSLRRFSPTTGRSLLAGVAAAATGAIAGELSCGRGWSHVLVHHVGSSVAIALACLLLSRLQRPASFAP